MDDDGEADLYGDLLPFDRRNDEDFKKMEEANGKLKHENDQLKQKIERLLLENRSLSQDKKKLETNFSSLIKTAQTEMKRKDQTIAELRREKDSVVFRRGRNSRYDSRPQERVQPDPHEIRRPEPVERSWEPQRAPNPRNLPFVAAPMNEEIHRPESVERSWEPPRAPNPNNNPPFAAGPIVEEVKSVVIPDNRTEEVAAVVEVVPNVPAIVPTSNECPKTVFSQRHLCGVNKPLAKATLPAVLVVDIKPIKEKSPQVMIPITTVSTPETQPEAKKKKRITPVMISEPTPRVVDKNKNKIFPPALGLDKSFTKVAYENSTPIATASEIPTPKSSNVQTNLVTPTTGPIVIPKSKIITHVKATYDTSNAKTTDFKRRVSTHVKDAKPTPESSPQSPLKRIPSFVSENSSDGPRRPSNYDLMKRNVKHKYQSLDSPSKAERSRRSRSRSAMPREKRDRSKSPHRFRTRRRSQPRRKDDLEASERRSRKVKSSVSRPSLAADGVSKRDSTPPRRRESPIRRRVPTFKEVHNFSPVLSSTAKKDCERKSSRDRTLLDNQAPSTSKTKVRLDDVLEKSVGKLLAADRLDRSQVESTIAAPKGKAAEPLTESPTAKHTETARKVPRATSVESKTTVLSPTKSTEEKRKSIEAVADSLTFKLTSIQTTETTSKTLESFAKSTAAEGSEPSTTAASATKTQITDVLSILTQTVMPIPPKDFLSARILADYKTPTASAENSREVGASKTMSPPDVPRAKSGPTSFSGIKLGDPKAFSYPFTPLKMDIANDCIRFPSLITPLKATPVKVGAVEEDSLDAVAALRLARGRGGLGAEASAGVLSDVERRLRALAADEDRNDNAASGGEKVGGKVSDESARGAESRKEDGGTKKSDTEDGEITDDENSKDISRNTSMDTSKDTSKDTSNLKDTSKDSLKDKSKETLKETAKDVSKVASKESSKPMVTFFKKSNSRAEPKAKRTRTAEVKVVGADQMSVLRQKLQARNECIAPARKDIRDYEIRLKSPFKTNPRVSSANASVVKAPAERLTYNEIPAKAKVKAKVGRSMTPEDPARRSESPSAMFLAKSPERFEHREPSPEMTSGPSRSKSPSGERRANIARVKCPRRQAAGGSRGRENADRHSTSASCSRSRSPQPPPLKRTQALRPCSQSRSRSPKPGMTKRSQRRPASKSRSKSPTKLGERSHRSRGNPTRPRSQSGSRSPPKIGDRLLRLANCNGSDGFRRRRARYVDDSTGNHTKRRSHTKSSSRSASPYQNDRRNYRSQESPGTAGRAERGRGDGRRDRSDSPEAGNEGRARESGRPFRRRRRTVFKDPPVSEQNKELIERILDSSSGISEKNISPVRKSQVLAAESPPDAPNLPDILATLDSSRSPVKARPAELRPFETRLGRSQPTESQARLPQTVEQRPTGYQSVESRPTGFQPAEPQQVHSQPVGTALNDFVSKLVRSANPDLQKCLDSIQTNFASANADARKCVETNAAGADKATTETTAQTPHPAPLGNGFARKRRSVRMLPQAGPTVADSGTKVADGSTKVADSSIKVADSSTKVMDGSTKVADGSTKVADGSTKVADGSTKVADGSTKVADSSTKVADSSTKVADSSTKVMDGSTKAAASIVTTAVTAKTTEVADDRTTAPVVAPTTNGFPFARRRRTVRILPPSSATTPNPTPTKEPSSPASLGPRSFSERSDLVRGTEAIGARVSPRSTDAKSLTGFPILEQALGYVSRADRSGDRSDSSFGAQRSLPSDRKQDPDVGADKRKRDSNDDDDDDGNPWTKRRRRVVVKEAKPIVDLARKAKSLFGSDTEEEAADFRVRDSEYVKLASGSEGDSYASDGGESDDSQEHWKPPRKHGARKKPAPEPESDESRESARRQRNRDREEPGAEPGSKPEPSIWPARPEEPRRRTTVFLADLPKSSEKIIEELMNRASKSMSAKKRRPGARAKAARASAKAPKSAATVPTDSDSD